MSNDSWRDTVNRRAKNLALMSPFFALEGNKGYVGVDLKPYDMHLLCSVLMEAIIAEMGGSAGGAAYDVVLSEVQGVVLQANPEATASDLDRIVSHILDHLTSGRGRDFFEARFQVLDNEDVVRWLTHPYRLLDQRLSPEGDLVYVATAEAIHIYLGGLGHDLEAEQAANDAILEHFLSRGKHREVGQAAETARKRSIERRVKIRGWLIAAERSFDELDYVRHVVPTLEEMRQHVEARGRIEPRQIEDVQTRALALPLGSPGRLALTRAREAIEDASHEHTLLLAEIQGCSRRLLEWQTHHRFRRGDSPAIPEPITEFLEPLLRLRIRDADRFIASVWSQFCPTRLPVLPDLDTLLQRLLADAREASSQEELVPVAESFEELPTPTRFTPEIKARAEEFLSTRPGRMRLSETLDAAGAHFGVCAEEVRYLALLLAQWFENGHEDEAQAIPTGKLFDSTEFFGDDLELVRTTLLSS